MRKPLNPLLIGLPLVGAIYFFGRKEPSLINQAISPAQIGSNYTEGNKTPDLQYKGREEFGGLEESVDKSTEKGETKQSSIWQGYKYKDLYEQAEEFFMPRDKNNDPIEILDFMKEVATTAIDDLSGLALEAVLPNEMGVKSVVYEENSSSYFGAELERHTDKVSLKISFPNVDNPIQENNRVGMWLKVTSFKNNGEFFPMSLSVNCTNVKGFGQARNYAFHRFSHERGYRIVPLESIDSKGEMISFKEIEQGHPGKYLQEDLTVILDEFGETVKNLSWDI